MLPIPPVSPRGHQPIPKSHPIKIINRSNKLMRIVITGPDSQTIFDQKIPAKHPGINGVKKIKEFPVDIRITDQSNKPLEVKDSTTEKHHSGLLVLNDTEAIRFMDPKTPQSFDKEIRFVFDDDPSNSKGIVLKKSTFSLYDY
jgi:hypothetical protein